MTWLARWRTPVCKDVKPSNDRNIKCPVRKKDKPSLLAPMPSRKKFKKIGLALDFARVRLRCDPIFIAKSACLNDSICGISRGVKRICARDGFVRQKGPLKPLVLSGDFARWDADVSY